MGATPLMRAAANGDAQRLDEIIDPFYQYMQATGDDGPLGDLLFAADRCGRTAVDWARRMRRAAIEEVRVLRIEFLGFAKSWLVQQWKLLAQGACALAPLQSLNQVIHGVLYRRQQKEKRIRDAESSLKVLLDHAQWRYRLEQAAGRGDCDSLRHDIATAPTDRVSVSDAQVVISCIERANAAIRRAHAFHAREATPVPRDRRTTASSRLQSAASSSRASTTGTRTPTTPDYALETDECSIIGPLAGKTEGEPTLSPLQAQSFREATELWAQVSVHMSSRKRIDDPVMLLAGLWAATTVEAPRTANSTSAGHPRGGAGLPPLPPEPTLPPVQLPTMLPPEPDWGPFALDAPSRDSGRTPLETAVSAQDGALLRDLVRAGANIHTESPKGTTPLLWAASTGEAASIPILLSLGASLSQASRRDGRTPLHAAVARGHPDALRAVLAGISQLAGQEAARVYGSGRAADLTRKFDPTLRTIRYIWEHRDHRGRSVLDLLEDQSERAQPTDEAVRAEAEAGAPSADAAVEAAKARREAKLRAIVQHFQDRIDQQDARWRRMDRIISRCVFLLVILRTDNAAIVFLMWMGEICIF